MSTIGKVLVVLVGLVTVGWVVLSAAVNELNRTGSAAVEKKQAEAVKLGDEVRTLASDVQKEKDKTDVQQVTTQDALTAVQARQADKEKERAQVLAIAQRIKIQAADVEANLASAAKLNEERLAEKTAETKAKADTQMAVATLMEENDGLLKNLAELREKFKATFNENKAMVNRLGKKSQGSSAAASSPARPASFSPTPR